MDTQNLAFVQSRCFAATYANISVLLAFVVQASHKAGLDHATADRIQIAVGEACSNIIKHGYGGEGVGEIICTCSPQATSFSVILRDQGPAFDPTTQPVRNPHDRSRRLIPGGWGIFLMRHFMDEIRYQRENEANNVLIMIKHKEGNKWLLLPEGLGM